MIPSIRIERSLPSIVACVVGTLLLLWADLWTKDWAQEELSQPRIGQAPEICETTEEGYAQFQNLPTAPTVLIDGYLEFRYAENCGAAFGLMRDSSPLVRHLLFGVAATVACLALFLGFVNGNGSLFFAWGVPFVVSGALGNLIDRIRFGYVVDFIRFHLENRWAWPTFNVADITISIGVGLLLIDGFVVPRAKKVETSREDAANVG